MSLQFPVDIANRALQHCGAANIAHFTDNTKSAAQLSLAYDRVRKAEQRRAVWRYGIRRAIMRPISNGSLFTPAAYNPATTYTILECVTLNGIVYQSPGNGNIGNTPGGDSTNAWAVYVGPALAYPYNSATQYFYGDLIIGADNHVYSCAASNTVTGQAPPNGTFYIDQGLAAYSGLTMLTGPLGYLGTGTAASQTIYRLPFGYLRMAPQDLRATDVPTLGVSAGLRYNDWQLEDQFLLSVKNSGPFVIRFVGDVNVVTQMDDMFCEGFAARLGLELVETLTQSPTKAQEIGAKYDRFMKEARAINALELASTEDGMDSDTLAGGQTAAPGIPANARG